MVRQHCVAGSHRAPGQLLSDARALNPTNGAGEVIAVRWDRDAAQLVEWWKGSAAHDAILRDPRFNVIGIGITFTDGDWRTSPSRYTMWGVVNFFGFNVLPAGTTSAPGGGTDGVPAPSPSVCDPAVKHMPPTLDLTAAAIKSGSDLLSVDSAGALVNRPWLGGLGYGPPTVIGGGFSSALQIFLTDWERDGVYDVLAQWSDGRVTLHSGLAGGGFRGSVTLGQAGWAGMTVALGQWCSNNRLPQLLALDGSGNLWLYHNTGLGDLSRRTMVGSGIPATRLSMVDYDADGFQDLLALQSNGNVLLYRGAGVPSPRSEPRVVVAGGWSDVTAIRPFRNVTGINSTGLALRRGSDIVQYWDPSTGALSSPSNIGGAWAGIRLAQCPADWLPGYPSSTDLSCSSWQTSAFIRRRKGDFSRARISPGFAFEGKADAGAAAFGAQVVAAVHPFRPGEDPVLDLRAWARLGDLEVPAEGASAGAGDGLPVDGAFGPGGAGFQLNAADACPPAGQVAGVQQEVIHAHGIPLDDDVVLCDCHGNPCSADS